MARQGMTELLLELVAMEWTDRDGMRHLSINSRVASSRAAASSPSGTWLATSLGITQPVNVSSMPPAPGTADTAKNTTPNWETVEQTHTADTHKKNSIPLHRTRARRRDRAVRSNAVQSRPRNAARALTTTPATATAALITITVAVVGEGRLPLAAVADAAASTAR